MFLLALLCLKDSFLERHNKDYTMKLCLKCISKELGKVEWGRGETLKFIYCLSFFKSESFQNKKIK